MLDKKTQTKVKKLCSGENLKINDDIYGLAYYGFIYFREKNNETEIIIPYELRYVVEKLFM